MWHKVAIEGVLLKMFIKNIIFYFVNMLIVWFVGLTK